MSTGGMIWSSEAAVLQAVLAALRADGDVQSIFGAPARIFDDETSEPGFPHAEIERHEVEPRDASAVAGQAHTLTFAVWLRHGGRDAAREALGVLRAAADRMEVSLPAQRVVLVQSVYSDVMRAPDLRSFRGVLRLRIITEEAH